MKILEKNILKTFFLCFFDLKNNLFKNFSKNSKKEEFDEHGKILFIDKNYLKIKIN